MTNEASSLPNSLFTHTFPDADSRHFLSWSAAAGSNARSITLAADIRPRLIEGSYVPYPANTVTELFCLGAGNRRHCLGYNIGDHSEYIGLMLFTQESIATPTLCEIKPTPPDGQWSRVSLTISSSGAPVVTVGGAARATASCTMTIAASATSVLTGVGMNNRAGGEGWSAHVDNVEIMIRR